jgi:hypothetical protein
MTGTNTKSSRRSFFLHGGAALGAGVAATAGAAALTSDEALPTNGQLQQLQQQLDCAADREAIRQLHLSFTRLVENQIYEAAVELFDEQAQLELSGVSVTGKPAIRQLFTDHYRHQKAAAIHSAYRQNTAQQKDAVTLSENSLQASATFHVDVELSTPLLGDSTLVKMARLQGQSASRQWETGRLEAKYVKTRGQWKMASLSFLKA